MKRDCTPKAGRIVLFPIFFCFTVLLLFLHTSLIFFSFFVIFFLFSIKRDLILCFLKSRYILALPAHVSSRSETFRMALAEDVSGEIWRNVIKMKTDILKHFFLVLPFSITISFGSFPNNNFFPSFHNNLSLLFPHQSFSFFQAFLFANFLWFVPFFEIFPINYQFSSFSLELAMFINLDLFLTFLSNCNIL